MKKVWTPAARAAFAAKMKRARAAAGRKRRKNPTKAQVKQAAGKLAKMAARTAWRGAKFGGRVGRESAKAATREVKRSICKNPARKLLPFSVSGGLSREDMRIIGRFPDKASAVHFARWWHSKHTANYVAVNRE